MSRLLHPIGTATSSTERLALAIAAGALGTLGFSVTAPLLPDLADALAVSRGSIGLVQAAVSVPGVLLSIVIGYLADRFGRRRVVLASLMIFSTFGLAGFWARSFWGLVAVRLIQGAGTSGILGLGIVLVGDLFEGPARTRAMGFNLSGTMLANLTGPIVAGVVGQGGVFRPFLLFVIGYPLALWATRMPVEQVREVESPLSHADEALGTLRRGRHLVDYVGVLVATVGVTVVMHGLGFTTVPLFLDGEFGIGSSGRGLVIAAFQVGVVLAAIQIGRLRSRHGGSRLVGAAFSMIGLGMAVTGLARHWAVVPVGLALAGFGFGLFVPQVQDRAATLGGPVYRGLTVLTWVTFVRLAQVIGPPTGSWSAESLGPRATFGIAALVMILAAVLWRPIRRRAKGKPVSA
ncbi:MAG: MFS transporter [Acidimicrobiia bacterium]